MALVAAVFGFTDFFGEPRIQALNDAWQHMIGNLIAVVLALINWFIRYRSGAPAGVLPYGILLSLVTVLLLAFNGWKGWELVYRHHVGVSDEPAVPFPAIVEIMPVASTNRIRRLLWSAM